MLLALSTSKVDISTIHRGIAATITTVVLIVAIESARSGPVNGLLASSPAVYLGKISYGTYLWHWPVILVARDLLPDISPTSTVEIAALIATGLASLSYHMVERPIREQRFLDRVHPFVIATGLAVGVLAALVMIPRVLDPYSAHATTAQNATRTGFTPIPDLDFQGARRTTGGGFKGVRFAENCLGKPAATCTILTGSGPHILLIGDSHAQMLQYTFAKIAQKQGLTMSMSTAGGCPWQRDLYLAAGRAEDAPLTRKCVAIKRDLYDRVIRQLRPDLVIAVSNDYLTRRAGAVFDRNNRPIPTKGPDGLRRLVKADTARSLAELGRFGSPRLIAGTHRRDCDKIPWSASRRARCSKTAASWPTAPHRRRSTHLSRLPGQQAAYSSPTSTSCSARTCPSATR